ncbi:MAG: protein-L-isoaspartate(D-aspartate) O-methyltransferase [Thermotogota bacterium]
MNFEIAREKMIKNDLISRGIENKKVLEAFRKVPREHFVPKEKELYAYEDHPITIGEGQTISQPYIVAYMIEKLNLSKTCEVLEIGTGSGYQTALLAEIFKTVYTIEKITSLQKKAKSILDKLNYKNIEYKTGNGIDGWDNKFFDNIIVSAAAREFPEKLISQLSENGVMVVPVGEMFGQNLFKIKKKKDNIEKERLVGVRFVPLVDD